ncbi:MAG: 2,3-bisphosphoglycerate-independent phosphoglycerate mutase [Firmicutes bacterium]|nr:2,3-bisphosphoglycerate-independent phosphoglycerate mutase [Bacillota bacterium]
MSSPYVLLIMDGFGLGRHDGGNAIWVADTPELDKLFANCPHTELQASGLDVGLPEGQIGNSEVGHTNIGAGRVVFQDLPKINNAIEDGSFFKNPLLIETLSACKNDGGALHLMGLLSPGGVHSHQNHFYALVEAARDAGIQKIYIHAFLDGRDVGPKTGKGFVEDCVAACQRRGAGKIATVQGRFYAMDRDKRWERLQKGYDALVRGLGAQNSDPVDAVQKSYDAGVTDEFVLPVVCDPEGTVKDGDTVIFVNFRSDRAREITWALTGNLPPDAAMDTVPLKLRYVCMAQYDEKLPLPVLYPPEELDNTFGEYVSALGLKQLRIAETEKYAHVTFFFNGGVERVYAGEDRVLVPSPKEFPTYDLIPEMSARQVTDKVVALLEEGKYGVVIMNLANCDMVGHTGVERAAVEAVEVVDECVGRVVRACRDAGGVALVTADHGNADQMIADDGGPHTAHTTNPVPFVVCGADVKLRPGRLADIAPTLLELMGLKQPAEMTGKSLIVKE